MFDFNKLHNFLTIAESSGITDAAKKLRRTQSAISQQIDKLEEELGVHLLERRGGKVFLTKEGRELHKDLKPLFVAMEEKVRGVQGRLADVSGKIRVGVTPSICDHLLMPVILEFKSRHPNILFELVLDPDEELERKLADDLIDCAFIIEFRDRSKFEVREFARFSEFPVCSNSYYQSWLGASRRDKIDMDALSRAALIDFDDDLPNIKHWLKKNSRNWQTISQNLSAIFVIENYSSVKQLVLSGMGIATLPSYLVEAELKSGALMAPFPNAKPTMVGLDFALKHQKNLSLPLKAFRSYIAGNLDPNMHLK